MKICHISDTHGFYEGVDIPKCDIIIHSGDFDCYDLKDFFKFIKWYSSLNVKYKIAVAGNHDIFIYKLNNMARQLFKEKNIIYLENELAIVNDVSIYGSPYTPTFMNWVFMKDRGSEIAKVWRNIPKVDILVTHGPPYGILDCTRREKLHVGCEELRKKVEKTKPKYHLFGHIHENYGITEDNGTTFINSSLLDSDYKLVNKSVVIEI